VKRRTVLALAACASLIPFPALAQAGVPRIGFLGLSTPAALSPLLEALRASLRERGLVEGKNIVIEARFAEGRYERLGGLAAELVGQKVAMILAQGTDGTRAAKLATTTIPIVMVGVSDPTVTGLVDSIARPGGNITGLIFLTEELNVKRLDFLRQALPKAKKFAALVNSANTSHPPILRAMTASAAQVGVELQSFDARGPGDFEAVLKAMTAARVAGLVVVDDAMFNGNIKALGGEAAKVQLPMIGVLESIGHGGMIAYGVNRLEMYRGAAAYVERLLKGARPSELPIERVANYDLVIDRKVAARLGITIPQTLFLRANRVVE
jgi:putative ABC transport system substrate-binding protein